MAKQTGTKCYDYIIAGCGGAGLSLAWYISQSEQLMHKQVLLLDADDKSRNDRTWCFWTDQAPPQPHVQKKSWQKLQLSQGDGLQSSDIAPLRYYCTAGIDFYTKVKEELSAHANFSFKQATVKHIDNTKNGVKVLTNLGEYQAKWAFSSLSVRIPKSSLTTKQHFRGWFIRSKKPVFEADSIRLMDFRTAQLDGPSFFYLLPISAHEALVEYTVISDQLLSSDTYEEALKEYIRDCLHISDYEILDTEKGVIPMTSYAFPRQEGKHVMRIGTAGGMTKASTGFTFKNMQEDAMQIVRQLETEGNPFYKQKSSARFRFYDTLLLHILKYYPGEAPSIFENLFASNRATTVLTFLDERTSLWQEAMMFMKLPWKPFLRSLWQHYFAASLSGKLNWKPAKVPYYVPTQPEETR